ncbi:MAG TPA: DUF917 domain-containing protein [Defluviitoga sp.]|nr:DUF917 domain-containing protein [Defluviitoga sp.]
MRKLDVQAIEDIAVGATILGTGGGGDPYIGKLMALQAIEEYGPVSLIDVDEVPDDALVVPSAMMGAPTVLVEKIPNGEEPFKAFELLKNHMGKDIFGTISIEAGGLNSMIPLALAARLGLPVVDADGMGRAFPELQMVTFTIYGVSSTPLALCDEKGNNVLLNTITNKWSERLARVLTVEMGGSTMLAIYPMTGKQLKKGAVRGTMSLAESLGRAIRESKLNHVDPLDKILEITNGYLLFKGKITDVLRKTTGGFARGKAIFEGIDEYRDKTMELEFQNENLVAQVNGQILASVPDLISVIDPDTGKPITTEMLRYGYRGVVIGIPCNEKWRTEEGLKLVGPRYFGYDIDYIPIEERFKGVRVK